MKESVAFGGITVPSGEKVSQYACVPGTECKFPVTIINGAGDGKKLLISAGIHGCEYPGIEAAVELSKEIDPKDVNGAVVIIHCVNMSGFVERQTYVMPEDPMRKNLNRLFPGDPNGTLADKLCLFLMDEFVVKSDFHIDIHSGDMVENLEACAIVCAPKGSQNNAFATEVAKHTSFKYRMNSGGRTEFYNSSSIDRNVPSMLFERGGHGDCPKEEVESNKSDLINIMKFMNILPGEAVDYSSKQIFFKKHEWTEANATGLLYKFAQTGDDIKEGQKIAEIRDMFGNLLEEVHAKFDGHIVISASTLGIKKGDDLVTYGSAE